MENIIINNTRTVNISQTIEVPDFIPAVDMTMEQLTQYTSRFDNASATIEKMFDLKIDGIKQWFQNLLKPFIDMPMEKFTEMFKDTRYHPIAKSYKHINNNCFYKITFVMETYNGKHITIYLGIDQQNYLVFTFTENDCKIEFKDRRYIQYYPKFLQGWGDYKIIAKLALEEHLNTILKDAQKKTENQELMANFLSVFSI